MNRLLTTILCILVLSITGCSVSDYNIPASPIEIPLIEDTLQHDNGLERVNATVLYVIDGDTYEVLTEKGAKFKVRALLVDSPESTKEVMAWGLESSSFTKQLIEGKKVILEYDKGERTDKYNRHLCYIYLEDGTRLQDLLLRAGLATVRYVYPPNTTHLDWLKSQEKIGRQQKLGVWSIPYYVNADGSYNSEAVAASNYERDLTKDGMIVASELIEHQVEGYIDDTLGPQGGELVDQLIGDQIEKGITDGIKSIIDSVFK
ncbi:thermonuclease family protein [Bacillus salitolerans]|uniref:Thermonuclease family protein n=1 Tax=Bacillus salitolerans TaxID=1437434 RepID=A0ABW4LNT4_9BACI